MPTAYDLRPLSRAFWQHQRTLFGGSSPGRYGPQRLLPPPTEGGEGGRRRRVYLPRGAVAPLAGETSPPLPGGSTHASPEDRESNLACHISAHSGWTLQS